MSDNRRTRTSKQVKPENTALADDLRTNLRGKPTRSGFNRSLGHEIWSFLSDILKIAVVVVLCICFAFGGFGAGMLLGYASSTKALSISDLTTTGQASQTSFVYDSEGNTIAKLTGSENVDRIYTSYSELKGTYIDEAFVAIEDERFYEHSGIDLKRIGSAILSALANGGSAKHGGSTITQQTVKLISGQDEHSTSRKVQEWFSAMELEQHLTKDEIMELYINLAPMGNNYVGVQAAAHNYFGKNAQDLNLAECALLAGLPKSPSYYNPLRESGRRNCLRRMRIILGKMHDLEFITDEEYKAALNTEIVFKAPQTSSHGTVNSYFAEYAISKVITDLAASRGISRNMASTIVYNRGYHIYTTMEPNVQAVLDEAFLNRDLFQSDPGSLEDLPEKPTGAMVVINTQTGAIAAMQGGYGEKIMNLSLNRATAARRSPGSSIKPLIDYGPALELDIIAPGTIYVDKEVHLNPSNPDQAWPQNYSRTYDGPITVRKALVSSKNTIAVLVWNDVGGDTALWFLQQVGIDKLDDGFSYPSQAIGGLTNGVTPLEMAAAYNTFAAGGTYTAPYAYTRVVDSDGNVILSSNPVTRRVYSPETCFLMADMLKGVVSTGTPSRYGGQITNAAGETIDTAGKTGTTSDNIDKWFCGFTPYYAAAVWYGYDNRLRRTEIPSGDFNNAVRIWMYCMQKIHQDLPGARFVKPDTIISAEYCSSGYYPTDVCRDSGNVRSDYFVIGSSLMPDQDVPCPIHVPSPTPTPAPTATPVPPPPEGGEPAAPEG
ncbi:MAG: transglycosylase domain-containing protein [Clostridiales bacterium]|nr:transglycosylase domain-containing protein [Clostridiales bacterium]